MTTNTMSFLYINENYFTRRSKTKTINHRKVQRRAARTMMTRKSMMTMKKMNPKQNRRERTAIKCPSIKFLDLCVVCNGQKFFS